MGEPRSPGDSTRARAVGSALTFLSGNFLFLLVSLVAFVIVVPMFRGRPVQYLLIAGESIVFIFAVFTLGERDREIIAATVYLLVWFLVRILASLMMSLPLGLVSHGLFFVFMVVAVIWTLKHVVRDEEVTANKIYAAVCAYFMLGLAWTPLYVLLVTNDPGLLELDEPAGLEGVGLLEWRMQQLMYYSYVTLTTLGYGDVVPARPPATTLAWLEALTGQLYLAVLIARLVGLHIAHAMERRGGGPT